MKVALVYRHLALGQSIGQFQVELGRQLVAFGHEVHIFAMAETSDPELVPGALFTPVHVSDVGRDRWSFRELTSFGRNASRLLEGQQFDCVYSRLPGTWVADILYLAGVASGEARRAGIGRAHRTAALLRHPGDLARWAIERRAVRSDRVWRYHVDSSQVADDLVEFHSVDRARISIIPPGVDTTRFRPIGDRDEVRRELGLPAGVPIVLFCGHDFHRKGLDRLIQAFARMRERPFLAVVGRRDPQPYRQLAERLGVLEQVGFYGLRTDAQRFFQAADVFVLPSRVEMWGAPVVEALATGVPPVVAGSVGAAEIVVNGRTGVVLREPFDVDELADALDNLLTDSELRLAMGREAIDAAKGLSWERHAARVEADMRAFAAAYKRERGREL